jgi:uncharacterized protein (TIGR03083 family)
MDATTSSHGSRRYVDLDRPAYLDRIAADVELLTAAATTAGPDGEIKTCPDWTIRELVHHQGEVHRWATAVVRDALLNPADLPEDFLGPLPDDGDLVPWFEAGAAALLDALTKAPDDLDCFRFLADPVPGALFWARRQTHETGMHRVDAESAAGAITPFVPTFAADGVDEMLTGFAPRRHTPLHTDPPRTLAVALDDAPGRWHVTISAEPPVTVREPRPADCTVTGSASDVYLALWNRQGTGPLTIDGDPAVLEMFRDNVKIRWS